MYCKMFPEYIGKLLHAVFIVRIPNVENLPVTAVVFVFDNSEKAFYAVLDICETSFLLPAVNKANRCTFYKV